METVTGAVTPGVLKLPSGFSWQNPAWSPDMGFLSLTRFNRYNEGNPKVFCYTLRTGRLDVLADGVSQPGACWSPQGIIYSNDSDEDAEGDAIFRTTGPLYAPVRKLFGLKGISCYEPSWSPDGRHFAVETHVKGREGGGRIAIVEVAGGGLHFITSPGQDCRQPAWNLRDDRVIYQRNRGEDQWDIFMQPLGGFGGDVRLTRGTDATWTPDGEILFSGNIGGDDDCLCLYHLTNHTATPIGSQRGYRGAPSMSPDGKWVACEASDRPPDNGPGTRIEIFAV